MFSALPWILGSWADDLSFIALAGLLPVRGSTRPCSPTRRAFSPLPTQPEVAMPTTQSEVPTSTTQTTAAAPKKTKKPKAPKPPPPPRPVKIERGTEVGPSLAGSHTTSDGESFPQPAGAEAIVQVAGTTEAPAEIEVHTEPVPEPQEPAPRPPLAVVDGGTQQPAIKREREATGSVPSQPRRRRDPNAPRPPPSAPPAEIVDISSTSSSEEECQQ